MVEFIPLVIVAVFTVLLLFLRTNAAVCFLALCAGSILVEYSGTNVALIASSVSSGAEYAPHAARIILLLVPMIVCAMFLRGQLPKALIPLGFLPALATSLLALVLIIPLLPENIAQSVTSTETWAVVTQYQELTVGVGVVMSVVLLVMMAKRLHGKHKKGH